tara:strand:+ start:4458 stop:5378 length:921 start_codon:yes stop_codon:yes gene_type:complete
MVSVAYNLGIPDGLFSGIVEELGIREGMVDRRRFPDGESYIRMASECRGDAVVLFADLSRPDEKIPQLLFASRIVRDYGANVVGLVTPYLPYMRQDAAFRQGEGVTARYFAELLSGYFDWVVTVDPHLHRISDLAEIFDIPTTVVRASAPIAEWIAANVPGPLFLVGPDEESMQWVADVASRVGAPFVILEKSRHGDRDVEVSAPQEVIDDQSTPVLIDDIISSGNTMVETARHFAALGTRPSTCIAVHALFDDECVVRLRDAAVDRVVTCNSIAHATNAIDLSGVLAPAIATQLCVGAAEASAKR